MLILKSFSSPRFIRLPLARCNILAPQARYSSTTTSTTTIKPDATSKSDKERSEEALKVNQDIKQHSSSSNTDSEHNYLYGAPSKDTGGDYNLPHPIWHNEFIYRLKSTHVTASGPLDTMALLTVKAMRFNFDWMSGWMFGTKTTEKALNRICFLETVAGVPGSIAAILRHLASLRRMRRDNGWIHTLLEEAENERMHLLTYLQLKQPGPFFRFVVWLTQGIFFNFFFFSYLVSPRFCHRLVGYLEEQAVHTYTSILQEIDTPGSALTKWKTTPAPEIAKKYWKLSDDASLRDVIAVTRADEAHHRDVNHSFAGLQPNQPNPFKPGF